MFTIYIDYDLKNTDEIKEQLLNFITEYIVMRNEVLNEKTFPDICENVLRGTGLPPYVKLSYLIYPMIHEQKSCDPRYIFEGYVNDVPLEQFFYGEVLWRYLEDYLPTYEEVKDKLKHQATA